MEKAREFNKNTASLTMLKPLTVWLTTLWKIRKEMGVPDYLTCFLRNLYVGQEVTVTDGHETTDWFQINILSEYGFMVGKFCSKASLQVSQGQEKEGEVGWAFIYIHQIVLEVCWVPRAVPGTGDRGEQGRVSVAHSDSVKGP